MRKLFFLFIILFMVFPIAFSQSYKIDYFINDYAGILSYDQVASIEPILKEIYDSKKAEFAVVIVPSLNGTDIESFSYTLAEGNLGDKAKNNGLLLVIALAERRYRFEVGRGLEPILPDVVMSRIGRKYLEPNFKNYEYAKGIEEASIVIKDILFEKSDSEFSVTSDLPETDFAKIAIIVIIVLIIFGLLLYSSADSRRISQRDKDNYFTAAIMLVNLLGKGKGGTGGFGGFGGGSFGGGGAGGKW